MRILDYNSKKHKEIIQLCVLALKQGKIVAYPTDTSYGLACDPTNPKALRRFYKIKQRQLSKPIHFLMPSMAVAQSLAFWPKPAKQLAKEFWPGPISLVLPLKNKHSLWAKFSAQTGTIGMRMPNNKIALDLVRTFRKPIPATSANPSAHLSKGYDSYSAEDIIAQFRNKPYRPDIIVNAGHLPKRKPSTMVKIINGQYEILRPGPISETKIKIFLNRP